MPTSNRSSGAGLSFVASRCATNPMTLLALNEASSSLSEDSRRTVSGTTVPGKTTISLIGRIGKTSGITGWSSFSTLPVSGGKPPSGGVAPAPSLTMKGSSFIERNVMAV